MSEPPAPTAGVAGFPFNPRGPFQVRNYEADPLADLEPVHELVETLVEQHKLLIPGSMWRLINQWRIDLWTAIEAKHAEGADANVAERQGDT